MAIVDVAYTDMLGGRVTFTQTETSTVRMTGQFNEGFDDPDARVLLYVGDIPPPDHLDLAINPPGTSAFEYDYQDATITDFTDVPIRVITDNEIIAVGDPTVPIE
ncbi:hypothetical protein DMB38_00015 [Streptomyces sp. WAC 06738]|uniref:hypothetical protein n=1 Tax=Streptomyces sp. WAC 06738 TaxID=2203210 RepID=UPI000F6C57C2|nr:hypothetical protein [Streptomyces sp. WAC 06738]AZM44421.1 hypothetical protein DMB38_00015 [Streptomyces sp. WAC 06738]